jgi:hypothetical protein
MVEKTCRTPDVDRIVEELIAAMNGKTQDECEFAATRICDALNALNIEPEK